MPLSKRIQRAVIAMTRTTRLSLGFVVVGLLLASAVSATAQPIFPSSNAALRLGLSEAFASAEARNLQLAAARRNLGLAQADITAAGAVPNPQLAVSYGFGPVFSDNGEPQQVSLAQTLQLGGKRQARLDLADTQYRLAVLELNASRFEIRGRVRRAYAELAAAEATARSLDAQGSLADRLVETARARVEAGAAPRSELLQAQLVRAQLQPQRVQAEGRIENARAQLATQLGDGPEQQVELTDEGLFQLSAEKTELVPRPNTPLPSLESLTERAYERRPELQAALQQIEVARRQLRLAQALRAPDLQVGAAYLFTTARSAPLASGFALSFGVTLPIFYNQTGEVTRAEAAIDQSSARVTALRQRVTTSVRVAYRSLVVAQSNVSRYRSELLPASENVLDLARQGYQLGKAPLSSVILAQQADQQIRSAYLDAVVAYQNAYADLEVAVGEPLDF